MLFPKSEAVHKKPGTHQWHPLYQMLNFFLAGVRYNPALRFNLSMSLYGGDELRDQVETFVDWHGCINSLTAVDSPSCARFIFCFTVDRSDDKKALFHN